MASKLQMIRPHAVGKEEAMAAALKVAERLKDNAQVRYTVDGDIIRFERSGAKGELRVSDTQVEAELEIGLALRPMKGLIETKMGEYFDRYLPS